MQSEILWVGDRRVFARRSGSGPALVMLHGSPESADAVIPQQVEFAKSFSTLALDTPGNGRSDPLAVEDPLAADFADALAATLDAAGIKAAALYGYHTGAGTAVEFALRYPERVTALALDGYAVWTDAERRQLLDSYLISIAPEWSGEHLTRLWARLEEQAVYFPWNDRSETARLHMAMPSLDVLQRRAMDWLRAGDAYIASYRSAFIRDGRVGPAEVRCPCLIGATPPDPLVPHLDRMENRAAAVEVELWPNGREAAFARMREFLEHHNSAPPLPTAPTAGRIEGFAATDFGEIYWRARPGEGAPLELRLHDAGESVKQWADAATPGLAIDLPGHGWSAADRVPADLDGWCEAVQQAAAQTGLEIAGLAGAGFGGMVATALQQRDPGQDVRTLGLIRLPDAYRHGPLGDYVPDLEPCWDGHHLTRTWRWLRRRAFHAPWNDPSEQNLIAVPDYQSAARLNERLVDVQVSRPAMRRAFEEMWRAG